MKTITISQEQFDEEFRKTLSALELQKLKHADELFAEMDIRNRSFINQLHRKFHYEVCQLKERIEKIYF